MLIRRGRKRRRGRTVVECAIVYPTALLLVMGTIISGMGVFRYQQIASLAREGARYAAVHGSTYQSEQQSAAPTASTVLINAIYPRIVALDKTQLTCTLTMIGGQAAVTLTYNWVPEGFFRPVTISSTSIMPITY